MNGGNITIDSTEIKGYKNTMCNCRPTYWITQMNWTSYYKHKTY